MGMESVSPVKKRKFSFTVEDDDAPKQKADEATKNSSAKPEVKLARRDERFERTRYALARIGPAIIGSAVTTAGCAAFLLPCQLVIFTKIGSVVMAVTLYAIIYTIVPLPALLMICGPCSRDLRDLIGCFWKRVDGSSTEGDDAAQGKSARGEDKRVARRYVLHMPIRSMGAVGSSTPPTRTRVVASG